MAVQYVAQWNRYVWNREFLLFPPYQSCMPKAHSGLFECLLRKGLASLATIPGRLHVLWRAE
jgi:hypothetical protein